MKSIATSVALLGFAAFANAANPLIQHRAVCNADNCARAVTGTNPVTPALASRTADCSSFMLATVTPAAVTSTVNAVSTQAVPTGTTTIFIGDSVPKKRQASGGAVTNSPTAVPSYASACDAVSRYSSACSCAGITKRTTTVKASTVFVTKQAVTTIVGGVATQTVTPGTRPACGSTVQGTGPCGCPYVVTCNAKITGGDLITSVNKVSESDCVNTCDKYDNCFSVDYSRTTGVCNVYRDSGNMTTVQDDDLYAFSQGRCASSEFPNPQCING